LPTVKESIPTAATPDAWTVKRAARACALSDHAIVLDSGGAIGPRRKSAVSLADPKAKANKKA
jgi:hypothetical protein